MDNSVKLVFPPPSYFGRRRCRSLFGDKVKTKIRSSSSTSLKLSY
jgi:hypothetical protein